MLGPIGNPSYKEYVADIHNSGKHLLNVINEILDLSRIEAGRQELQEESIRLAHVVEEAHHMVQLKAKNKGINIVSQFEDNLPLIWADERAVRQITLNLLSNALKFTPTGGTIWLKVGWTQFRRPVHGGQGHRPGHTRGRNSDRAFRLRPGLDRHQERRTGHRARPADRAGA